MTSAEYQQVIENFYEKVVTTNFNRLKKGVIDSLAEGLNAPMPIDVQIEVANTLNAICSYHDVLLRKDSTIKKSALMLACSFANNRLKHDARTAGMVQKNGGFYLSEGQCHPGIHYEEPFCPEAGPEERGFAPFFESLVPDVNWVLIGDFQPEEHLTTQQKEWFFKQKAAYKEHFEGQSVVKTLKMVLNELGIVLNG